MDTKIVLDGRLMTSPKRVSRSSLERLKEQNTVLSETPYWITRTQVAGEYPIPDGIPETDPGARMNRRRERQDEETEDTTKKKSRVKELYKERVLRSGVVGPSTRFYSSNGTYPRQQQNLLNNVILHTYYLM